MSVILAVRAKAGLEVCGLSILEGLSKTKMVFSH